MDVLAHLPCAPFCAKWEYDGVFDDDGDEYALRLCLKPDGVGLPVEITHTLLWDQIDAAKHNLIEQVGNDMIDKWNAAKWAALKAMR